MPSPDEFLNLALQRYHANDYAQAAQLIRQAIARSPANPIYHYNLGLFLHHQNQLDHAIASYQRAISLNLQSPDLHNNLGLAQKEKGQLDNAIASYYRALSINPNYPQAHNNLGIALKAKGQPDQAIAAYQRAIAINPNYPEAYNNLANVLSDNGQLDQAIAAYRQVIALKPDSPAAHSNLVYALQFHPDYNAQKILHETRQWAARHERPLANEIRPHPNNPSPTRRLRIGYVSPDFRAHPIGRFILPLLENHDHANFEIFCYSDVRASDDITQRIQATADTWRNTTSDTDAQFAKKIRADQIDLLVDLTMHMAGNRLLAFARKPAPVQVTYLALISGTGMQTMDYRLTDPYLDPPGTNDDHYAERSIRLPHTYWCYQPTLSAPDINPLPVLNNGYITFACLNSFSKITTPMLTTWISLLKTIPNSRLILHANPGSPRNRVQNLFQQAGLSPTRINFVPLLPLQEYFHLYHKIDIALDPFPYPGGTTTLDALWMGVPLITLAGPTGLSRCGLSILSNLNLPNLAAHDPQTYINIAAELANDLPRLQQLRSTLRERMLRSPLMNAAQFTLDMESAYRRMWQTWCDNKGDILPY